jgi:hypothetical protein
MKRLTIFAKGNLDLKDTLHSLRRGKEIAWNGINTPLRERGSDVTIRVRHETWSRSDALLEATGTAPESLVQRGLRLGTHPLPVQFSDALFSTDADAYVLSIQPDLQVPLARHRREGFAFNPHGFEDWPAADREWLRTECSISRAIDVEHSMANFEEIIRRLRSRSDAPILIYNVSSVVPGETIHCHQGMEDSLSTRIRRFNLALAELSQRTGISIIDVDRIVACQGAQSFKLDTTHLTAAGCRAVAEEVLRVLGDYGCLGEGGLRQ